VSEDDPRELNPDLWRRAGGAYPPGWARAAAAAVAAARDANAHRRAAVLAHPDLAARLTQPPLSYSRPERWNGYIPPRLWREEPNTSPQRAALVEIAAEAMARELAEEIHHDEDPPET
jgi:hypothetical protein